LKSRFVSETESASLDSHTIRSGISLRARRGKAHCATQEEEEELALRNLVFVGGVLLIGLGILHAVHVGRADEIEPYLWIASFFLISQGVLTVMALRSSNGT
tara:strand:- start:555 stop:860 length:306 start_codon:yes stop_codon:yes gene_type:complete